MRRAITVSTMLLMLGVVLEWQAAPQAGAVPGQTGQEASRSRTDDLFTGSWKINRVKSHQTSGQPPLKEDITIRVENGVEHYTVDVENADGTKNQNRVDATLNDGKYYPYVNIQTGKTTSQVMMVRTDARTEYRFMKNAAGESSGVLMRRMAEDGKSYTSTMMTLAGEISLVRVFERQ
jgi:hypothetical protein